MAKREQILDFVIDNAAGAGDLAITGAGAPGAGKAIRVLSYTLIAAGAVNVTWKSGATAKSGAMPLAANTGVSRPQGGDGDRAFTCAANQALLLGVSGAVQVSGHGTFAIVPASGLGSD